MQMTYELSRYGISDGQVVVGGIYNFDTWERGGPNASSLATLSYYQTFLNKQVELKIGYQANVVEYWGQFLAGNLSSGIFGPSGLIPVEAGLSAYELRLYGMGLLPPRPADMKAGKALPHRVLSRIPCSSSSTARRTALRSGLGRRASSSNGSFVHWSTQPYGIALTPAAERA